MSMKYFTLSAVCMLVFCMLLALSGTTDFPGVHPGISSPDGLVSPPSVPGQAGKGDALAAVHPPAGAEARADGERCTTTPGGAVRQHRVLLFGAALILVWVLLSFRILSKSKS